MMMKVAYGILIAYVVLDVLGALLYLFTESSLRRSWWTKP